MSDSIESIISELEALEEAAQTASTTDALALVALDEEVATKQAARAAAVTDGDAEEVADIDSALAALAVDRENLVAKIGRGYTKDAATVDTYIARVAAIVAAGDSAAASTFSTLKASAVTAAATVENLRKSAFDALFILSRLAPADLVDACKTPAWKNDRTKISGIQAMARVENIGATR